MTQQATPATVLKEQYKTSTANRLTSIEEFNRDAEDAILIKRSYTAICGRISQKGQGKNGRRQQLADYLFETYTKPEIQNIKNKTWGVWRTLKEAIPPQQGEQVWVRMIAMKPVKKVWDGEAFINEDGTVYPAVEWSLIYK